MADTLADLLAQELAANGGEFSRALNLPSIRPPAGTLASLLETVRAIKMVLDAREGASGSILDKGLTLRDLIDAGAIQMTLGSRTFGATAGDGILFAGNGGPGNGYDDPRPVLDTPPALTALAAVGTFKSVFLDWEMISYQNHSYVEVFRADSNSRGLAVSIGTSTSNMYVDLSAVQGTPHFYWVRAVGISEAGSPIFGPDNAVSGTAGSRVLIDTADYANLSIVNAAIANAAIDDAKILNLSVNKLTAGSFQTGSYIQSLGFVPGGVGFRLDSGGNIEARSIGGTRVFNLNASGSNPVLQVGSVFSVLANGTAIFSGALSAATGSFAGSLTAATGTFAGALSAATGTFNGSLNVQSAASGERMTITNSRIRIYDASNVLRVKIGDLS